MSSYYVFRPQYDFLYIQTTFPHWNEHILTNVSMLGISRIQCSGMSGYRDTIEGVYGCSCMFTNQLRTLLWFMG